MMKPGPGAIQSPFALARWQAACCLAVACMLLHGCSLLPGRSLPTSTPFPTPQVLRVAFTPAVRPVQSALSLCAEANSEISLFITEVPATLQPWPQLASAPVDILVRLGEEESLFDGFAAQIATENVIVVVPAENPLTQLTGEQVRGLFSGEILSWNQIGGSGEVQPYIFPDGDEVRTLFDSVILRGEPVSPFARLAPGPAAMLESIESDPTSIGYLPAAWLTPQVRPLELDPVLNQELARPVLVLAHIEPAGAARLFMSCLQVGEGQAELQKTFTLHHK